MKSYYYVMATIMTTQYYPIVQSFIPTTSLGHGLANTRGRDSSEITWAFMKPLKNQDQPRDEIIDDNDRDPLTDDLPPAEIPVVIGTIIFVYSIYFIYLALFTDEILDPRVPLAF